MVGLFELSMLRCLKIQPRTLYGTFVRNYRTCVRYETVLVFNKGTEKKGENMGCLRFSGKETLKMRKRRIVCLVEQTSYLSTNTRYILIFIATLTTWQKLLVIEFYELPGKPFNSIQISYSYSDNRKLIRVTTNKFLFLCIRFVDV